jgi:hypothetical protein
MRPSFLAVSAAILSIAGFTQAVPQGAQANENGGQSRSHSSSASATSSKASSSAVGTSTSVLYAAAATSTTACNNSPDLCNRNYNNITHLGAHDAAFLRDSSTSFSTSGNQYYNATIALSAGVRLLQAQVHNQNGTLQLCHTSCSLLNAGTLTAWLADIKTWMDSNTNDVVTILLVNSDDKSAATFGADFVSSGISDYGYTPTSTTGPISTWPTLQTLINANTRLVAFVASITYDSSYPYLMNEFDYMFETAYDVESLSGFNCTLNRPTTLSSAATAVSSGYMPFMNHFVDTAQIFGITVPDVTDIKTTNSANTNTTGALGTEATTCKSEWGIKPTYMLVDFWNVGPAIDTADLMNGITATGRTKVSSDLLTASSSSASRSLAGIPSWALVCLGLMTVGAVNVGLL